MIWFDNYGQEYDALRYEIGEEEAFAKYSQQNGKLIITDARKENDTRLFIQSLYDLQNIDRKEGWWNTFTICNEPQKAGTYISRIINVCKDKNGYPIFVAKPIMELNIIDICKDSSTYIAMRRRIALMAFFRDTGLFTEHKSGLLDYMNFNTTALYKKFKLSESRYKYSYMCELAMTEVILGNVALKEIVDLLLSPTDEEIAHDKYMDKLNRFLNNRNAYSEDYPYLVNKLNRMVELDGFGSIYRRIDIIVARFNDKYDNAVYKKDMQPIIGDTFERAAKFGEFNGDIFARAEAYLKFDAERKAQNSAAKTAAKKAKKAAAKAAKANET